MNQAQIDRCLPFYKEADFYAMEVWGGAVPDSVMRYLNENPWTRLETIHKAVGNVSKLTALSRGRNLFGYAPYTDEIIDGFCRNAIESGLGIMRIFDALNDVNNVKSTVKYVKQYGGIADCAVCYTVDPKYPEIGFFARLFGKKNPKPVFTDAYFLDKAKQMAALGADMITIKDMSGLIPRSASAGSSSSSNSTSTCRSISTPTARRATVWHRSWRPSWPAWISWTPTAGGSPAARALRPSSWSTSSARSWASIWA